MVFVCVGRSWFELLCRKRRECWGLHRGRDLGGRKEAARPSAVVGPVEFFALARLASICADEDIGIFPLSCEMEKARAPCGSRALSRFKI